MTTVVDPLGTPVPIYNRSGAAIISMVGGATSGSTVGSGVGDDASPIARVSQATIVLVITSVVDSHHLVLVRLPDDADIGDVAEVYKDPTSGPSNPIVFPNVGEAIGTLPASTGSNSEAGIQLPSGAALVGGIFFRKVSSILWMPIGAV